MSADQPVTLSTSLPLNGRTALVTGGFSGLGWHFAHVLAQAGAQVVVAARSIERGEQLAQHARQVHGLKMKALALNVTNEQSVTDVVGESARWSGALDIVVNNAGVAQTSPALALTDSEWKAVMDVNLDGVWRVAQHSARVMAGQTGRGGSLINVASILGLRVAQQIVAYATSKAAVIQMTKALALEWARKGIRVNALAPGYIETELNEEFIQSDAGQALVKRVPMRRLGRLEELTGPLLLLAGEAGTYMTGSIVVVDGGHSNNSL